MPAQFNQVHNYFNRTLAHFQIKLIPRIIVVFLMLICCIPICHCSTCPASSSNLNEINSFEDIFSGFSTSQTVNVAYGLVSNSLFYVYWIQSTSHSYSAIRKAGQNNLSTWTTALSFYPILSSLIVDTNEQYLYVGAYKTQLDVIRLTTGTGGIYDVQSFTFLDSQSWDIKIHLLSDSSGYYVTGKDGTSIANICKYLYSTPTSSQCQKLTNFSSYAYGQLKLSDTTFFLIGLDPSSYDLHLYKLEFSSASPTWALKLACSSTCLAKASGSVLASSSIYSLFIYGNTQYLYMAVISSADGTVNAKYKSSASCSNVHKVDISGDYIAASACSSMLVVFNRATNEFSNRYFSGIYLLGIGLEEATGRFVLGGQKGNNGYITKFMAQSLPFHPDFQTMSSMVMNVLSSGTEDITLDSTQTIGAVFTQAVSSIPYSSQTVSYTQGTSYTSDVNYQTNNQSVSVLESIKTQVNLDLPCSISGATPILFSTASYITSVVPSWVIIDSISGILSIESPEVTSDTEYDFYITSSISGISKPVQKLVKLTILNCSPSNCQKCKNTNSKTCEVCSSGYYLASGACETSSETAQALRTTTKSVIIAITGVIVINSILNLASFASLWMTINQQQLFFLLLLTRAFIPIDIRAIIEGSDFTSNVYEYLPLRNLNLYPSVLRNFEFELTNSSLEPLGIKYNSTFANMVSTIECTFLMIIFSILVCLLRILFSRFRYSQRCSCLTKVLYWILDRIFRIMIFGYFIRSVLEMSQFILISSVNEMYNCNTENVYRLNSLAFSILMILIFLLMVGLALYLIFSSYRLNESEHNKLEEFFRGIKKDKKHKFYVILLLLRRTIFVTLLITCTWISSRVLTSVLTVIQVVYVACISYLRPYVEIKANLIEILNELYFGFLILFLAIVNNEGEWSSDKENLYMWILVSNTFIVFFIVLCFFIKECVHWIIIKLRNSEELNDNTVRIIPKQNQYNNTRNLNSKENCNQVPSINPGYSISNQLVEESKSNANINLSDITSEK